MGLFVEDANRLDRARPLASEVCLLTARARPVDPESLAAQLEAQAERARVDLRELAKAARVRCFVFRRPWPRTVTAAATVFGRAPRVGLASSWTESRRESSDGAAVRLPG